MCEAIAVHHRITPLPNPPPQGGREQTEFAACADSKPIGWCRRADSNRQPIAYEAIALPLSYCGVQRGPSTKLLSKNPPLVEEAQLALSRPRASETTAMNVIRATFVCV